MIYTYTDRSYLRIGEEFSELGSNPVQAKIFDPELHGELGGSLEPRWVEPWGTHVCGVDQPFLDPKMGNQAGFPHPKVYLAGQHGVNVMVVMIFCVL